ncbi:MAG: hypothetical protein LBQ60_19495 [Bacteroidales bacterium]|jgi:hypothetical protein|nr:hypothetical protein [Bacteroidales bacterium]
MKNLLLLLFLLSAILFSHQQANAQTEAQKIDLCIKAAGDVKYVADFPVQLSGTRSGERIPQFRKAIALRKGNRYRFTICTDELSLGEGVLRLFDENRLMGTSYDPKTGKEYRSFDFDCHKTGAYILFISFKDGKEGSAVGIVSHVKTL